MTILKSLANFSSKRTDDDVASLIVYFGVPDQVYLLKIEQNVRWSKML